MSDLEARLAQQIDRARLPVPRREYRFEPPRRWRFDFAWPNGWLAVECEGGTWIQGRHTRGKGFQADCEKYNAAAVNGWRVLRFTREMVESGQALTTLIAALGAKAFVLPGPPVSENE